MKKLINRLLERRTARWGVPLAVVTIVAASVAWSDGSHRRYQLGGAFIGSGSAGIWSALQIPLDPAGRTAAIRVNSTTYSDQLAGLFAALGATDLGSDAAGEAEMISRDTARYGTVFYGRAEAPGNPRKINSIFVMTGTVKFTGPDNVTVSYIINVFPVDVSGFPNTDTDGDGFPDPGAQPLVIPGVLPVEGLDYGQRVTLR